jgi:hypothetical protein
MGEVSLWLMNELATFACKVMGISVLIYEISPYELFSCRIGSLLSDLYPSVHMKQLQCGHWILKIIL